MRIEEITIHNFKKIQDEHIELNGRSVYVLGKNAVGKTSFIDAVFKVLSGDLPPTAVTTGEKRGEIRLDLGDYIVEMSFNENSKHTLSLQTHEGVSLEKPRTKLNEIIGCVDFNISKFLDLPPKKQVEVVKHLVGIDFTDLDEEYKKLFDRRRFVKSKIDDLEANQKPVNKIFEKPIDIENLQKNVAENVESNTRIHRAKSDMKVKDNECSRLEKEINELSVKIINLKKEQEALQDASKQIENWLTLNDEIDISEIQAELTIAIDHNKKHEEYKAAYKVKERLIEERAALEDLQLKIDEIDLVKRRNIAEAKLPVEGMTFDDNQLYLDGLPFEKSQINTARMIVAGLQIGLAQIGQVRIARFDGSLLDNDNLAEVEKWAEENDLQLFVEFVDRESDQLKIIVKED